MRSQLESGDPADVLWGADEIGKVLNLNPRQAHYLLISGKLPGKKIGGRWVALRSALIAALAK